MLKQLKQRKESGFTIIEVMIVLAIAGLIMVVVFLAVPALQRSGRNNALTSSANNILASMGDFASNNNGAVPTTAALATGVVSITGASGTNGSSAKVDTGVSSVTIDTGATPIVATGTGAAAVGAVEVITGTKAACNPTNTNITGTASARSYVLLYVAESGSGNIVKCVG